MRNIALIAARGGSKGLPKKNIRDLAGYPLIAWTIHAALECACIDRVIVSTDDEEIASIARQHGAEVPFLRPSELAQDDSSSIDVLLHALSCVEESEVVTLLQPTSPLRSSQDIEDAFAKWSSTRATSCVSVRQVKAHPNWLVRMNAEGFLIPYDDAPLVRNRQELQPVYVPNGAIYMGLTHEIVKARSFYTTRTTPYIMSDERSWDIDSLLDFEICEMLLSRRTKAHSIAQQDCPAE